MGHNQQLHAYGMQSSKRRSEQEEMTKMLIETGESSCLGSVVLKYLHEKDTW